MTTKTLNQRAAAVMGWAYFAANDKCSMEGHPLARFPHHWRDTRPDSSLDDAALVRDKAIEVCGMSNWKCLCSHEED